MVHYQQQCTCNKNNNGFNAVKHQNILKKKTSCKSVTANTYGWGRSGKLTEARVQKKKFFNCIHDILVKLTDNVLQAK